MSWVEVKINGETIDYKRRVHNELNFCPSLFCHAAVLEMIYTQAKCPIVVDKPARLIIRLSFGFVSDY